MPASLPMLKCWWICTAGACSYHSLSAMCKGEKVLAHGYGLPQRKDGRVVSPSLYCTPQKLIPLILGLKGIWQVEVCRTEHCSFMWLTWHVSPSQALWKSSFFKTCHSPILYRKMLVQIVTYEQSIIFSLFQVFFYNFLRKNYWSIIAKAITTQIFCLGCLFLWISVWHLPVPWGVILKSVLSW